MKNLISTVVLVSILFFTSYAQDNNKPTANSFGLQYGVNFNGTVGQAVQLSGWLKNGIEVRGALTFSYTNSQSSTTNYLNYFVNTPDGRTIPAVEINDNSSASLAISPSISVVKHFPIKGNLDFFLGGSVTCGITTPTAWTKSSTTETADSFYYYYSNNSKSPVTFNWGASLTGGANYFFYKNLAIGADFGLGFSASNGSGTAQTQQTEVNSGLNNTNTANYNNSYNSHVSNNRYSATLTGNAGLHLTYYLKVKDKKKSGDDKM